jgi:hypothetical protein
VWGGVLVNIPPPSATIRYNYDARVRNRAAGVNQEGWCPITAIATPSCERHPTTGRISNCIVAIHFQARRVRCGRLGQICQGIMRLTHYLRRKDSFISHFKKTVISSAGAGSPLAAQLHNSTCSITKLLESNLIIDNRTHSWSGVAPGWL